MTRRTARGSQPQISESWASSMDGWAEGAQSVGSVDDGACNAPQAPLSTTQMAHLREGIDDVNKAWSSPESARQASSSQNQHLPSDRDNLLRGSLGQSAYGESPRRRNARTTPMSGSEFIMPSVDSLPQDRQKNSRSTPQLPRQQRRQSHSKASSTKETHQSPRRATTSANQGQGTDYPALLWSHIVAPLLQFAFSVLRIAGAFVKPFIMYALALWVLFGGFILLSNFFTTTINGALTPLCRIPGSSFLNLPFCESYNVKLPKGPAEFNELMTTQSAFDEIFTASVGQGNLPMDMKRSEASIRDLRTVVQYSNLPSRNELVFEFTGFIQTARQASRDLAKYNSRIGRGIDQILTTNKWTLQVLDGIADAEANRGSISRVLTDINIFAPFLPPQRLAEELVLEQYLRHTATIQDEIHALIKDAEVLLNVLDNLDERLDLIDTIATKDGIKAQGNKDELFAYLWTKLGGNKSSVARIEAQLNLLKDVSGYRKLATAHVAGTIVKLQAIQANLEDLRERVAQPELVGTRDGRLPLEMHIHQIELGVDRLERLRQEGREIGEQRVRSILDRDDKPALAGSAGANWIGA